MSVASLLEASAGVDAVVFDLGNVLADDVWERMLLTPRVGLADRLGLDRSDLFALGVALWREFATTTSTEDDWWAAVEREQGVVVPAALRSELKGLVRPHPELARVLEAGARPGVRIGLASDNTPYWYALQAELTGVAELVDGDLSLLSFEQGVLKRDTPGLYDLLAERTEPGRTLVVDDRLVNLGQASRLGFRTLELQAWPADYDLQGGGR